MGGLGGMNRGTGADFARFLCDFEAELVDPCVELTFREPIPMGLD